MPCRPAFIAALGLAATLSLAPLAAEEANPTASPTGTAGAATRLVLADALWRQGLTDGQPLYLLTAIQLARSVTLQPATGWERTTTGGATDAPPGRAAAPDPASEDALAIVRNLAEEDPTLQEVVYDLDAQVPRSPTATAVFAKAELAPGQTDSWRIVLFGAVPAELGVIGDGDSRLGLTLVDEAGVEVCATPLSTGPALCRLTPARNG
ncbi:MAG: hypothetical protein B7Z31_12655, partial [Rhodobacterales bacterium 12-65-15]